MDIKATKYHVEVQTVSCGPDEWTGNSVKHDDAEKAEAAAKDLYSRWTAVKCWRVTDDDGYVVASNKASQLLN